MADDGGWSPVVTITFGECAENHVGMQKVGEQGQIGLDWGDLEGAKEQMEEMGAKCDLIDLCQALSNSSITPDEEASVLIVRNGVDVLLGDGSADALLASLTDLEWDTKAKMKKGRVVEKRARHNLCFGDEGQDPDYEAGRGTIVAFHDLPLLSQIRDLLPTLLGPQCDHLLAEGNLYFSPDCGIRFHGDAERKIVVALRLGGDMPLDYHWFHHSHPVGSRVELMLRHGDIYVMSEKATGWDWKLDPQIPTLRHAAGASSFRTIRRPHQ